MKETASNPVKEMDVLTEESVSNLLQCFKSDLKIMGAYMHKDNLGAEEPWDYTEHINWDCMMLGIKDLIDYTDFMLDIARCYNDNVVITDLCNTLGLLDDAEQEIGTMLDYWCDPEGAGQDEAEEVAENLLSPLFWESLYHVFDYIEQLIFANEEDY